MALGENMTGIVGTYAFDEIWRMSKFTYYGLLALQHRGQESVGISSYDKHDVKVIEKEGFVDTAIGEEDVEKLSGWVSLGYVSSRSLGTCMVSIDKPRKAVVCMCNLEKSEVTREVASIIAQKLANNEEVSKVIDEVLKTYNQPITFIAINASGELIAFRDPLGIKPLCIGSYGFDFGAIASESAALECIGADPKRDIKPGELFIFRPYSIERCRLYNCERKICAFEYIYFARPDSIIDDISIYEFRYSVGVELANEFPVDADVVIGIPETAIPFAIAYSQAVGKPLHLGFISTGRKYRTAIKPSIFERVVGVQLKLNPIKTVFRGKKVVIIDDSMIRGTTTKNVVTMLKNRIGAKEVHVLVGSPKVMYSCPFGMEVPPRDELIAANLTDDEIASILNADSLHFLNIETLLKVFKKFGVKESEVCMGCFTGNYPKITLT